MVSSTVIERYLKKDGSFLGCFPHDRLPTLPRQFPKTMIINTHDSSQGGEHWLALILTKNKCFYFDSFGLPIINKNIASYLNKYYKIVSYSNVCIQHITSVKCGEFCVAFIKNVRSKNYYEQFLSHFNSLKLKVNDYIVDFMLK